MIIILNVNICAKSLSLFIISLKHLIFAETKQNNYSKTRTTLKNCCRFRFILFITSINLNFKIYQRDNLVTHIIARYILDYIYVKYITSYLLYTF